MQGNGISMEAIVECLQGVAAGERSFGCTHMLECAASLEDVKQMLLERKAPEDEVLADMDRILLTWLRAVYCGVIATPDIVCFDLLEVAVAASGAVAPFIKAPLAGSPDAVWGVPSRTGPEVVADGISELTRIAAAALIGLHVYLNFAQHTRSLAPDEVVLVFSTIGINSCAVASNAQQLDAQIDALMSHPSNQVMQDEATSSTSHAQEGVKSKTPPSVVHCQHLRWLLHWARSTVMNHMGAAAYLAGDKERQKDHQWMVKSCPDLPVGYSLYARSCMSFQQMQLAVPFLERGLQLARKLQDDSSVCTMAFQLAVAVVLGGRGAEFEADEVLALIQEGETARQSALAWFPPLGPQPQGPGEPDRSLFAGRLRKEFGRVNHGAGAGDGDGPGEADRTPSSALNHVARDPWAWETEKGEKGGVNANDVSEAKAQELPVAGLVPHARLAALKNFLYVTRPPSYLPPGALIKT